MLSPSWFAHWHLRHLSSTCNQQKLPRTNNQVTAPIGANTTASFSFSFSWKQPFFISFLYSTLQGLDSPRKLSISLTLWPVSTHKRRSIRLNTWHLNESMTRRSSAQKPRSSLAAAAPLASSAKGDNLPFQDVKNLRPLPVVLPSRTSVQERCCCCLFFLLTAKCSKTPPHFGDVSSSGMMFPLPPVRMLFSPGRRWQMKRCTHRFKMVLHKLWVTTGYDKALQTKCVFFNNGKSSNTKLNICMNALNNN